MKLITCLLFFITVFYHYQANAQKLNVINSYKAYKQSVYKNEKNTMVSLKSFMPLLQFDLKYSTKNNFTGVELYPHLNTTYLRKDAAMALSQVASFLQQQGIGLKIFDAYRPYSATKLMWDMIYDERYVANPANGSGHNRGIAIDLTLTNINNGEVLDMGTAFDNFTDSAHHSFTKQLPPQLGANRELLKTTMEKFGFKSLATEWWHYSFSSAEVYDVLDIDFKILRRKIK